MSARSKILLIDKSGRLRGGAESYFISLCADLREYFKHLGLDSHCDILFFKPIPIRTFVSALFAENVLFVFNVSVLFQFFPLLLIAYLFRRRTLILPHVVAPPILMKPKFLLIRQILYHLNSFLPSSIICISEGNRNQLLSLPFVSSDKLITIYNYVSHQPYNQRSAFQASSPVTVAIIGRLQNTHKGQLDLIRLNAEFIRKSDIIISLYGDGPDSMLINYWVSRERLTDNVILHGHVNSKSIYLGNSFSAVLCYSYWEGLPLNLLEAYSYGKIVIGRDIPGVREIIYPSFLFSSDHQLRLILLSLHNLTYEDELIASYSSFVKQLLKRYSKDAAMTNFSKYFYSEGLIRVPPC